MTMKLRSEQALFERDLAAMAHDVDLTIDLEGNLAELQVPSALAAGLRAFLEEAFEKHGYIGYVNRLKQVQKMLEKEDLQMLVNSTNEQLLAVLHSHRKLAPYEPGFEG